MVDFLWEARRDGWEGIGTGVMGLYGGQGHRHFISNAPTLLQLPIYVQCVSSASYVAIMIYAKQFMDLCIHR